MIKIDWKKFVCNPTQLQSFLLAFEKRESAFYRTVSMFSIKGSKISLTFGNVEAGELYGLCIVDHGGQPRVYIGCASGVRQSRC